ncbi:MAG: FixG Ig-like domain-containing protein, partial [Salaquimonas sp.]
AAGEVVGDCIDCNACVAVCPTGIDIRDGQQLECITCALCIDACDDVMGKLGREKGLISYATLRDYNHNMAIATDAATGKIDPTRLHDSHNKFGEVVRNFDWRIVFRVRSLIYMGAWAAIGFGLLFTLLSRDRLEVNVLHDRNPVFVTLSNGDIRNGYTVKLLNMIPEPRIIFLSLEGLPGATMHINGIDQPDGVTFAVPVEPDKLRALRVFVQQPLQYTKTGKSTFTLIAEDRQSFERDEYSANFEAPAK